MGFFKDFKEKIRSRLNVKVGERYQMVTMDGNGFYSYDGKLYHSDVVRASIKPFSKALGKAVPKHIRKIIDEETQEWDYKEWPELYMRILLEQPNPYMTGQVFREKLGNLWALNNNAFVLIVRDKNGLPTELYPIPCRMVEVIYDAKRNLYLKFYYKNGKSGIFPYTDIIHLRDDFIDNDVFGERPGPVLTDMMECVKVIDQGIMKAIKNSGVIRWLLKFTNSMRPESIKENVKAFTDTYLSIDSETFGAAGVDAKADIVRVEPKDYVPNAMITKQVFTRIMDYFGTNEKINNNSYNEDEYNAYLEGKIRPALMQLDGEFTRKLFNRIQIYEKGDFISFEACDLSYLSVNAKLQLIGLLDRAVINANEFRGAWFMGPRPGGDKYILRKDTGLAPGEGGEDEGNTD